MRVLLCLPAFTPAVDFGGPVTKVRLLGLALAELGVDVEVLTSDFSFGGGRVQPGARAVDGLTVNYVPRLASRKWVTFPRRQPPVSSAFDVVHCFGLRDGTVMLAHVAARRRQIPVVVEPMGMLIPRVRSVAMKSVFDSLIGQRVLRSAAITIATSRLELAEFQGRGVTAATLRYNPILVNEEITAPPADKKVFDLSYVGRLTTKKQLSVIVEVLAKDKKLRALVAGPDENGTRAELVGLARAAGVNERLETRGWVDQRERSELIRASRCFVLPSLSENFGNAAAEAIALGVPVVVSEECGVSEVVRAAKCGVVTSTNLSEFASEVIELLADADRLRAFQANTRAALTDLAPDRIARQQLAIYESVL